MCFVDLDGTLLSVSSEKLFLKRLLKKRILSLRGLLRFLLSYVLHPLRTLREGKGWNRTYLMDISPETAETEAGKLAEELVRNRLHNRTVESIREFSEAGSKIVILSASLLYIAGVVGEELSVDMIFASIPEIINGRFSGNLTELRPWGKSKAVLMKQICEKEGISLESCIAVGDSWADRFIMKQCGAAIAVYPDGRLRKLAERKGWKIIKGSHIRWA
ncbi:MAG: HAD-IB family phosphatase [Candidatus Aegiribacteria sp.]|nr:HAD-IB family phosphatase [Candidatus Aegiribacteria sp.]